MDIGWWTESTITDAAHWQLRSNYSLYQYDSDQGRRICSGTKLSGRIREHEPWMARKC